MNTTKTKPAPLPGETVEQRFHRLKTQWATETKYLSDPAKIMGHPAMQELVAMGPDITPLILRELQAGPSVLVWALPEILGAHPELEGNVAAMTEAWLQWGHAQGLV